MLVRRILPIIITFLLSQGCNNCIAQGIDQYNLTISNNLPSNFVYNITPDHLGYLWIGTNNGITKYNGYTVKEFDLSKGFITKDIWNFFEDKKGRMWLFNISDQLGYIYKDKYHRVYHDTSIHSFYPRTIRNYKDGIGMISSDRAKPIFAIEKDDTVHSFILQQFMFFLDDK